MREDPRVLLPVFPRQPLFSFSVYFPLFTFGITGRLAFPSLYDLSDRCQKIIGFRLYTRIEHATSAAF